MTFRKERVLGIWINADSRVFDNVPSYLAVLANRPLDAIANRRNAAAAAARPRQCRRCCSAPAVTIADASADDPFRQAFLQAAGRSSSSTARRPTAITFLTPTLFRAAIPLPAEVPIGNYEVDVRLFADGALIARTTSAFEVYKAGFEQIVTNARARHGFALRPGHRHDGAGDRLARERRVPAGLKPLAGRLSHRQAALGGDSA